MTSHSDPAHASGAKDPAVTGTSQKIWGFFSVVFTIITVIFIIWGVRGCALDRKQNAEAKKAAEDLVAQKAASAQVVTPSTEMVEALVPVYEGYTPCTNFVGWDYKIRTDGHPLRIKYQECDWIDRPSEGDFKVPETFRPGETIFVSTNLEHLNIRVQIYKKVKIQK